MSKSYPGGGCRSRLSCIFLSGLLLCPWSLQAAGELAPPSPEPSVARGESPALSVPQESAPATTSVNIIGEEPIELPPLIVTDRAVNDLTGSSTLTQKTLRTLPTLNPNISDLAPLLPGVQASDDAALSTKGGEILPALISISGGKADQNSFIVDGIGSGSLLDPLSKDPESPSFIPGHPQALFPNVHLIDSFTVIDHNIPARYSNFTGGVIDVQLRKPQPTLSSGINARTNRSEWTWFHLSQEKRDTLETDSSIKNYPQHQFEKYDVGGDFNIPTSTNSALVAAYQRTWSNLRFPYLDGKKSQRRLLENYLVSWSCGLDSGDSLNLSLLSTPYQTNNFLKDTKDSDYSIRNRNLAAAMNLEKTFQVLAADFSIKYSYQEHSRNSPQNYWKWAITDSRNWGTDTKVSNEGGYGSLATSQESLQIEAHLKSLPIDTGWLRQEISGGISTGWKSGRASRDEAAYRYTNATTTSPPADCGNDPYCVANEQYFRAITIYDAYRTEADRSELGAYLENKLTRGPLTFRPGVRFDYDTFSENQNLAPRFASSYDFFGTQLRFGVNRYYGEHSFNNVLRENIPPVRVLQRTNFSSAWTTSIAKTANSRSDLKTPYSDEVSAGIQQPVPGGHVALDYVHRKGKDEIARQFGPEVQSNGTTYTVYRYNNNGRSRYESYRFSWEGTWKNTTVIGNISREEAFSRVEQYDDYLDDKTLDKEIYYNGRPYNRDELPRGDYNRSWRGNLILTQLLPLGFEFSNVTRYRGPYRALKLIKTNQSVDGKLVDIYGDVKSPAGWIFDWKLAWRQAVGTGEILISLELLNVFNHSNRVGGEEGLYEAGRQIWAGVEGRF